MRRCVHFGALWSARLLGLMLASVSVTGTAQEQAAPPCN